jgi:hypothetical protein
VTQFSEGSGRPPGHETFESTRLHHPVAARSGGRLPQSHVIPMRHMDGKSPTSNLTDGIRTARSRAPVGNMLFHSLSPRPGRVAVRLCFSNPCTLTPQDNRLASENQLLAPPGIISRRRALVKEPR